MHEISLEIVYERIMSILDQRYKPPLRWRHVEFVYLSQYVMWKSVVPTSASRNVISFEISVLSIKS